MKKIIGSILIVIGIIGLGVVSFPESEVSAETTTANLSGYSWSQTLGWMQLQGSGFAVKSTNTSATRIDLSGYGWMPSVGWVSFEKAAVSDIDSCSKIMSQQPGITTCDPYIDLSGTGPYRVRGFARACSVFISGCSGELKDNLELGGWDGYISLNSGDGAWGWSLSTDKKTIFGFAWGDQVMGWLDINATCTNCGDPTKDNFTLAETCANESNEYIPSFNWSTDPTATSCTLKGPAGGSVTETGGTKEGYRPTGTGFVAPETGTGSYTLSCLRDGKTVNVGTLAVERCKATNDTFVSVDSCAPKANEYIPSFNWSTDPTATSCTLKGPAGGSVTETGGTKTGYRPTGTGFVAPETGTGSYTLSCLRDGKTVNVGTKSIERCADDFGYCPTPFNTIKKANAEGTNCTCDANPTHPSCESKYGYCPIPMADIKKIDKAGTNCTCIANPSHISCKPEACKLDPKSPKCDLCTNLTGEQYVVPKGYFKQPATAGVPGLCKKAEEL